MRYLQIIFFCLLLSSCSNSDDNKKLSQLIGSGVGAIIGSELGSGTGKQIFTILGAAGGYLIGGQIADILNDRDRIALNKEINNSLENGFTNQDYNWESNTEENTSATITPGERYNMDQKNCRNFKKTVIKNDKVYESDSKACRDPNGNWIIS